MDDQQNRSIFYIHCRHMPTKSGKVTKGYKKKEDMGCKPSSARMEASKAKQVLQYNHHGMCTTRHPNRKPSRHQREANYKTNGLRTASASTTSTTQTWHTT